MDHSRFTAYVERYGDLVTRLLLLRCRQVEDAQDCFQAVFLKLYTHGGDDWEPERVKAWLIRTAIHEAASLNRQVWRRRVVLLGTPPTLKGLPRRAAPGGNCWIPCAPCLSTSGRCCTCTITRATLSRSSQKF